MAAMVSYLVGMPLLRLGSDYFGIATLGFAIMVYTALQNSDTVISTMKGARGMVGIPHMTSLAWAFGVLMLCVVIMRNLLYSSHGRAIMSVREDEIAAKTMGIDVPQLKTLAFTFGGLFAGLAGGLYAHQYNFLHPSTFNVIKGFDPLIIIVFGGLGSMTGTLVASFAFVLVIEGLRVILPQGFEDWRFVIYPIILLLVMLLRQKGLLGTSEWGWLRAPLPPARDIPTPARPATPGGEEA
jgi:branched-chain amino acid transport system permease protein